MIDIHMSISIIKWFSIHGKREYPRFDSRQGHCWQNGARWCFEGWRRKQSEQTGLDTGYGTLGTFFGMVTYSIIGVFFTGFLGVFTGVPGFWLMAILTTARLVAEYLSACRCMSCAFILKTTNMARRVQKMIKIEIDTGWNTNGNHGTLSLYYKPRKMQIKWVESSKRYRLG